MSCEFDCLSHPIARVMAAAEGEQVARFHYAQTKIDQAADTILVDTEVVTVIEEQQQAVRIGSQAPIATCFPAASATSMAISRSADACTLDRYSDSAN